MNAKNAILAALLAVAVGAEAQFSDYYYHRTGDTVYIRSEIGYYNWWDWEQLINDRVVFGARSLDAMAITAVPFFTPAPLRIVGIAGCPMIEHSDTCLVQEYFYLFDAEGDRMVFKEKLAWDLRDPHRTLIMPCNMPVDWIPDSCCGSYYNERAFPLYEYYFDAPITVDDSFYIGLTNKTCQISYLGFRPSPLYWELGQVLFHGDSCNDFDNTSANLIHPFAWTTCGAMAMLNFTIREIYDTNIYNNPEDDYVWHYAPMAGVFLVYPLIEIDTTLPPSSMCDPVQNFQATVLDTGNGCVFFAWDDFLHYTYCEVEYYAAGQGYTSSVLTQVSNSNMLHVCGLDTTDTYFARARAYCDTSKTETAWTDWIGFGFNHSNPPQGISQEPTILDRFTHIMPNPAADAVTVSSELGLHQIDILNARGILVYSGSARGSRSTINLQGWPAGQYLVSIETTRGKTVKRLVVAR